MIRVVGCEVAREMLPEWVDGELGMADQVTLEAHLRLCSTCRAHVEDLHLIGSSLRYRMLTEDQQSDDAMASLQTAVLGRWRAERAQSWSVQARALREEMHLFWAGAGAMVGVALCLLLTAGAVSMSQLRPDSLAGVLGILSRPGSDENPIRLSQAMLPPRMTVSDPNDPSSLESVPEDDAVFALSTVVTREGRISDYELLVSHYLSDVDKPVSAVSDSDASMLHNTIARSRFAPAQAGGSPVAVNMVWLVARTTVKGPPKPFDFDEFVNRPRLARMRPVG